MRRSTVLGDGASWDSTEPILGVVKKATAPGGAWPEPFGALIIEQDTDDSTNAAGLTIANDNIGAGGSLAGIRMQFDAEVGAEILHKHTTTQDKLAFRVGDAAGTLSEVFALTPNATSIVSPGQLQVLMRSVNDDSGGTTFLTQHLRPTWTDGDTLGNYSFGGYTDGPSEYVYAGFSAVSTDVSSTTQDGDILFFVSENGVPTTHKLGLGADGTRIQVGANLDGTDAMLGRVGGVIYQSTTTATSASTTETDLWSQVIGANVLDRAGDSLHISYAGTIATSANNKTLKVKLDDGGGASTMLDTGPANPAAATDFFIECDLTRVTSTTQKSICTFRTTTNASWTVWTKYSTPNETLTGTTTLKLTGTESGTGGTTIAFEVGKIRWESAP